MFLSNWIKDGNKMRTIGNDGDMYWYVDMDCSKMSMWKEEKMDF